MTVSPAHDKCFHDTRTRDATVPGRLLTPAHKVTGCGEFTRRSDVLQAYAVSGRQLLQAVGAWHELWTVHSRSDGTIWLTVDEVAAQLHISRALWVELAAVLEAGGLLEAHGDRYAVPDAAVMEGLGRHYAPGGWRSLHSETYRVAIVDRLGYELDGPQRLAVQGVMAWVLLRHTAVRGTTVARPAKAELARMLDPRTLRRYLQLLAGVLDTPCRGRLSFVARAFLEAPLTVVPATPTGSPADVGDRPSTGHTARRLSAVDVEEPAPTDQGAKSLSSSRSDGLAPGRNASSRARSRSGTTTGQEQDLPVGPREIRPPVLPAWGNRAGTEHPGLAELVVRLEEHVPGAWEVQARPDVRQILSAALFDVGDLAQLVDALCADPFDGVKTVPGVLRSRAATACERVRRRRAAEDLKALTERRAAEHQQQLQRDLAAKQLEQRQHAAAEDRSEQDRAAVRVVAGAGYDDRLEAAGAALFAGKLRSRTATERAVLAAVRDRLAACWAADAHGGTTTLRGGPAAPALVDVDAAQLREVVDQVLDELATVRTG